MAYSNPAAYLQASVETASPARLLVMLYDRLALDCRRAVAAQEAGDHDAARPQLLHAQDIVTELHSSLRVDAWDGGPGLSALYSHLLVQLVRANVDRDVVATRHCLDLVEGLADAWRQAALQAAVTA
ncbi:flagellar export chaperone FliS [Nocardioides sp. zg-1228]|uniref:flagellar export chaperone FliS n=1 Tax=Nocardioides sp. zg-1228 TaxID=2763008 RepID=UPI0016433FB0|nr:flagellar export chaperone FliS [Nocardioides sp. zg-1228]MBC2932319.1 flagellar export chaperone FliS [Nocardioides sp. zg-1228]QSF57835.1 flagellar export chaperone FliS [Nocardioides sp. zg-1228]